MGQKLFGIDIAGLVHRNMSAGLVPLTLTRTSAGTRSATDPTAGTNPRTSSSVGRGFVEEYRDSQVDGEMVERGDRKIIIIGDSLKPAAVPSPGDSIAMKIAGTDATVEIVQGGVRSDPANATYTCQVRAY